MRVQNIPSFSEFKDMTVFMYNSSRSWILLNISTPQISSSDNLSPGGSPHWMSWRHPAMRSRQELLWRRTRRHRITTTLRFTTANLLLFKTDLVHPHCRFPILVTLLQILDYYCKTVTTPTGMMLQHVAS